jgi:hypothetical protein
MTTYGDLNDKREGATEADWKGRWDIMDKSEKLGGKYYKHLIGSRDGNRKSIIGPQQLRPPERILSFFRGLDRNSKHFVSPRFHLY